MPKFSQSSKDNLAKAHPDLQKLFNEVIKEVDCRVLDSVRDKAAQELAFNKGNSKAHFGQSPHNYFPSFGVDVVPWPLDWDDLASFRALAKVVKAKIAELGLAIDWGGDWKSFRDYPHWEVRNWKAKKASAKLYTGSGVLPKPAPTTTAKFIPPVPKEEPVVPNKPMFDTIFDKVKEVLEKPNVPVDNDVAGKVAGQITEKLGPIMENATNQEPWYKSRIYRGLIVTAIGFIVNILGAQDIDVGPIAERMFDLVGPAMELVGMLYAAYGRFIGNKKAAPGK